MLATPLGEAFVRRATAILNDVRRARDEFEQLRGNAVGSITVGLSIAAHLWLLPKVLKPFRRRYPKVHLHIIEGFYPTLPTLAMRSQSALTLLTCLAHSDLLAMAPAQWTMPPFASRVLTAVPVKEELSAPPIIAVTRADVPPSPAAGFLLDLIGRAAGYIGRR